MSLNQTQVVLLENLATSHAKELGLTKFTVVIPVESLDYGFEFHPDYHEMVNTVEIHTTEGCSVLVVNANYEVIDNDWDGFLYD